MAPITPRSNPPLILGFHLPAAPPHTHAAVLPYFLLCSGRIQLAIPCMPRYLELYTLGPFLSSRKPLPAFESPPTVLRSGLWTCHRGLIQQQVCSSDRHKMCAVTQRASSGLGQELYFQNRWRSSSEWQGGPRSRQSCSKHLQLALPRGLAYSVAHLAVSRALRVFA